MDEEQAGGSRGSDRAGQRRRRAAGDGKKGASRHAAELEKRRLPGCLAASQHATWKNVQ